MYHWDLPAYIHLTGGWLNEATADAFYYYADALFYLFGDRISYWMTFNEPASFIINGYNGFIAPVVPVCTECEWFMTWVGRNVCAMFRAFRRQVGAILRESFPAILPIPGPYTANRIMLLAHANAYRLYYKKYRDTQFGQVGIVLGISDERPKSNSSMDAAAAERAMAWSAGGWFVGK